jgi:hypothetical protein
MPMMIIHSLKLSSMDPLPSPEPESGKSCWKTATAAGRKRLRYCSTRYLLYPSPRRRQAEFFCAASATSAPAPID